MLSEQCFVRAECPLDGSFGETKMNIGWHRTRQFVPHGLCALLLYGACAVAAMAAPLDLPPLADPASGEHHIGKMIWADLVTPDLAGAKRFYAELFGWTFRDFHSADTDYAVALLDGRPVAGLFQRKIPPGEQRQPAWLTFLAVRDVDAAKRTALEHGAKVVFEPKSYAGRGRQAVFADSEGAAFAVLASNSDDPPDFLAAPGDWIWSALLVHDPDTEAAFYQALFGYDVFELPSDDGLQHLILSSDEYARASINSLPTGSLRRHPHWLNFVRVVNTVDAAAKAVSLGGRVLVEPHIGRHGGKVALVADPTGAPFGLMEWSDTTTKEEPK
jgi:predicted enzyme related to lactoylglutathione lyase